MAENSEGMAKHPFENEISMCVHHGFNQPSQQENCQFDLKRKEMERMKKDCRTLDFTRQNSRAT